MSSQANRQIVSPVHEKLETILKDISGYFPLLEHAATSGDFSVLEERLNSLIKSDENMGPFSGEDGSKYYKPFHKAAVPKIMDALRRDLPAGKIPTISLTFDEIDNARRS